MWRAALDRRRLAAPLPAAAASSTPRRLTLLISTNRYHAALDDAFCCLDYGFATRCATCPFPRDREPVRKTRQQSVGKRPNAAVKAALETLGLAGADAHDVEAIKAAMRKRAKACHPDNLAPGSPASLIAERSAEFIGARAAFVLLMENAAPPPERPSNR